MDNYPNITLEEKALRWKLRVMDTNQNLVSVPLSHLSLCRVLFINSSLPL